jgi:hypothetical protein
MEITTEIKQEKAETLNDDKKSDLFFTMLNGNTVQDTITTSRGDFTVKFPKQGDLINIARLAALMRAGIPAGNFDSSGEYEIQKCATLDVIIDTGPSWFNKIKKDLNFSWRNMPDAGFVDEVYAKALSFRAAVQEELRGIKSDAVTESAEEVSGSVPPDVGGGLFSGVASAIKRGRAKPPRNPV